MQRSPLTVRLATPDDEALIRKHLTTGFYESHDYLGLVLTRWLSQPERKTLIVVTEPSDADGHSAEPICIGLDSCVVLDSGKTLLSQALRVLDAFRGQGVSKLLAAEMEQVCQSLRSDFPLLERARCCVTKAVGGASIATFVKQGYSFLDVAFDLVATALPNDALLAQASDESSLAECRMLLFDTPEPFVEHLELNQVPLPAVGLADWIPFEFNAADIADLARQDELQLQFCVSCTADNSRGLSHGHLSRNGTEYYCTVYATCERGFKAHFAHHVRAALASTAGYFVCMFEQANMPAADAVRPLMISDEFNGARADLAVLEKKLHDR